MPDYEQTIFISYAWGDEREKIVNQLDQTLQKRGIKITRDKRDLGYRGSIKEFMERIGHGNCIIVVISDKYLRSKNCMFELVEIAENKQFFDRIFPIILPDAKIYDAVDRLEYVEFWEKEKAKLNEKIKNLSDQSNLQGIREELDNYDRFRDKISGLTNILKDMNALTPDLHQDADFTQLYEALVRRTQNTIATSNISTASHAPTVTVNTPPFGGNITNGTVTANTPALGNGISVSTNARSLPGIDKVSNEATGILNSRRAIRKWWHDIQRKFQGYSCYGVFLVLPSDKEVSRYLLDFGVELERISRNNCVIIFFGDGNFERPNINSSDWQDTVNKHIRLGESVNIAQLFEIGYDQFPCLVLFEDIRSNRHVVIYLKGMTAEEIAEKTRTVFTIIQKATSSKQNPLTKLETDRNNKELLKMGRSIVTEVRGLATKSIAMAMEALIKAKLE